MSLVRYYENQNVIFSPEGSGILLGRSRSIGTPQEIERTAGGMVNENSKHCAPKRIRTVLNLKFLMPTTIFDFSVVHNCNFLKLSPAVRCIHAKKRGMPLPFGLGLFCSYYI
jgi:hypothetical protein